MNEIGCDIEHFIRLADSTLKSRFRNVDLEIAQVKQGVLWSTVMEKATPPVVVNPRPHRI